MRTCLENWTTEIEKSRNQEKPQQRATRKPGLDQKDGTGLAKWKKEERKRQDIEYLGNKQLRRTLIFQAIRENREVAQSLSKEESKMPIPQCMRQMEIWRWHQVR
jgi:hypothetical protein